MWDYSRITPLKPCLVLWLPGRGGMLSTSSDVRLAWPVAISFILVPMVRFIPMLKVKRYTDQSSKEIRCSKQPQGPLLITECHIQENSSV